MSTILYTHPQFRAKRKDWVRYRDLYEGKHEILTGTNYLWLHAIEGKATADPTASSLRAGRELRTRYLNLVEAIVSLWQSYFFREKYKLGPKSKKLIEDFEDDIDGRGTALFAHLRDKILVDYLLFGKVVNSVDAFSRTGKNLAEQKELGIRPFMELLHPLCVPDWDIESEDTARIGKYNFLRHEYDLIKPRSWNTQPTFSRFSQVMSLENGLYTVSTYTTEIDERGEYKKKDDKSQEAIWTAVTEPVVTQLKEIPVAVIDSRPWLHDVCEETLRFYNLRSNLDNINYFQGYDDVFVTGVTDPNQMKAAGETIVKFLPQGSTVQKLPPVAPTSLETAVGESLSNVFKVGLNMFRALPADSKAVQGADTMQEDKDNAYAMVESSLDDIETLINDSLTHWAAFQGITDFESDLELCRDIKPVDFGEFIKVVTAFKDKFSQLTELDKAITRRAIEELDLTDDEYQAGVEELKAAKLETPEEKFARERKAAVGNAFGK